MKLTVTADTKKAEDMLTALVQKQLPFARMTALNRTGEEVFAAAKAHAHQRMVIRASRFIDPRFQLRPSDRAQKTGPRNSYVTVHLRPAFKTEPKGTILGKFVTGGTKQAKAPDQPVIIPTQAIRPSFRQLVPLYLYPKPLGVFPARYTVPPNSVGKSKKSGRSRAAKHVRPFILDPKQMRGLGPKAWGIYRRTGPKRGDIEMIWAFRRSVPIPKALPFYDIARRVVGERWATNMSGALAYAVRTARR